MIIIDITIPIRPTMLSWPGDPCVEIEKISDIEAGDQSNVTQLTMSAHTGTHIDAPRHFFSNAKTIDQVPLEKLIGDVLVMTIEDSVDIITRHVLENHPDRTLLEKATKVLFRTKNSTFWKTHPDTFQTNYVGIGQSAAEFLCQLSLELIGIDYLSIAHYEDTLNPHRILLSKDIILLEGVDLSKVSDGLYELFCLPINIFGSDGAPARAILINRQTE